MEAWKKAGLAGEPVWRGAANALRALGQQCERAAVLPRPRCELVPADDATDRSAAVDWRIPDARHGLASQRLRR